MFLTRKRLHHAHPVDIFSERRLCPRNRRAHLAIILARRLAERFWPGPLTLVLPVPGGEPTGFRVPDHPWLLAFLWHYGAPVVATSANPSDLPPATAANIVRDYFAMADLWLVDGGATAGSVPSTVIDCASGPPRLLRAGPLAEVFAGLDGFAREGK